MAVLEGIRRALRGRARITLVAAIAACGITVGASTAQAAPKFQSTKVVKLTPAQVAKVIKLADRHIGAKAKAAQSTTTLTVGYGCDQVALWASVTDSQISTMLNTSGGFARMSDRWATRYSATILGCDLGLESKNGAPIRKCNTTVVVGGTDAQITGVTITYRNCYG